MSRGRWNALPYLLIAPALACELIIHIVPTLLGFWLAFRRLNQFTIADWTHAPFAGLGNYRLGLDPGSAIGSQFWSSFERTALFTLVVVALSWLLGLFAAVLLNSPFRGRAFFRAWFLIPFALPAYVTGIGWRFMFDRDGGAVNRLLIDDLHLSHSRPFWLIGGNAFWAMVIVAVWRMWPFAYLMLLAALQAVPGDLYEAAAIDGASTWRQFRSVTLPSLRRMNAVVVLVMGLWSFNEFTIPYVLFGDSPPSLATLLPNLIYRYAFSTSAVGVASAMNVVITIGLLVASGIYVRRWLSTKRVA